MKQVNFLHKGKISYLLFAILYLSLLLGFYLNEDALGGSESDYFGHRDSTEFFLKDFIKDLPRRTHFEMLYNFVVSPYISISNICVLSLISKYWNEIEYLKSGSNLQNPTKIGSPVFTWNNAAPFGAEVDLPKKVIFTPVLPAYWSLASPRYPFFKDFIITLIDSFLKIIDVFVLLRAQVINLLAPLFC